MHSTKRLIAAGLAALLLLSAFGCTKKAQNAGASLPASTAGTTESTSLTEPSSEATSLSTTLPPSSTTKKATVTKKNINTQGNKITDDPKYIGDLNKREEEDPQYKPKPDTKPIPTTPDTLTTSPPTTKKQTTTKRPTTTTVKPTSGNSSTTTTVAPSTTTAPPVSGWHTAGGKTYFYNNGKPVTGWQSLNGLRYYFDNSGVLSSKVGLDVSEWNETIDWPKVKEAGVDFVMIRVGFRGWGKAGTIRLDAMFKKHLQGASQAGLECGVYFFTQAITPAEAREEARFVLAAIEGFTLTYPIAFDIEDSGSSQGRTDLAKLTNQQRTDICIAFSETIKIGRAHV